MPNEMSFLEYKNVTYEIADEKARQDLVGCVNNGYYDSNAKKIILRHDSDIIVQIDATDFIKDGMVSNVQIINGYLVITFNTDAGQEPIRIPITDIFNPDNYYTKAAANELLLLKQDVIQDLATIRSGAQAGATAVQPSDMDSAIDDSVVESGIFDLSVHNAVEGVPTTYADLTSALTALNALESKYKRGGMSMKFIHSSDNKYVQYRLMSNTFRTTESDWQKQGAEVTVTQNITTDSDGNGIINIGGNGVGEYAGAYKLIEIVGIGTINGGNSGVSQVGDIYYNNYYKQLHKCTEYHSPTSFNFIQIPFYKGAIYQYNGNLYFWNGTDLVDYTTISQQENSFLIKLGTNQVRVVNMVGFNKLANDGKQVVDKVTKPIDVYKIYGVTYNNYGQLTQKGSYRCRYEKFYIKPNASYTYSGVVAPGVSPGIVYLDAEGNRAGVQFKTNGEYTNQALVIPPNAVMICAASNTNTLEINITDYPSENDYIEKEYSLTEIELQYTSQKRIDANNGTVVNSSSGKVSDIILIDNTKEYHLSSYTDQNRFAVAYYNSETVTDTSTWLGAEGLSLNGEIDLHIPLGAKSMRICSLSDCHLYYKTEIDNIPSDIKKTETPLSNLVNLALVNKDGEQIGVGIQLDLGQSGGELSADKVNVVSSIEYKLDTSPLTDSIVTLNTGWSGNLQNGFTHTSGNTEPLEFDISSLFNANDRLLITFTTTGLSESAEVYVSAGDGDLIKSYNGGTDIIAGLVYSNGKLKFTPTSNFVGILTNIKCRKLDENGTETLTIGVSNVYCQNNNLVYGYWNVAIGGKNSTFSQMTDGTRNIAIGVQALNTMKVGNRNIAIGTYSMPFVTTGENNVAIGSDSIYPVVQAQNCVAIGKATMGGRNVLNCVAIGHLAMGEYSKAIDRSESVAVGAEAGTYNRQKSTHVGYRAGHHVTGTGNTSIGNNSMVVVNAPTSQEVSGDNNTCIGYNARIANTTEAKAASNSMALGADTTITKSNQVIIGNGSITEVVIAGKKISFNEDGTVTWTNA